MHPIRLKKKVALEGRDLWARKAKIIFFPLEADYGWMWLSKDLFFISINPDIAENKARRLRLFFKKKRLNIYEYIGVLRWFGLCDLCIESTSWPPHYGRALEFWEALKPFCEEDNSREISWYTLKESVCWTYPEPRNNQVGFTEIKPNSKKELKMQVTCSYPEFGTWTEYYSFPDKEELERLCSALSQGWPPYLYKLLNKVPECIWPHFRTFLWTQEQGKGLFTLIKFVEHRAADLLGSLSLLCRDGLLSANVNSVCSGHKADLNVISKADKLIYRLE